MKSKQEILARSVILLCISDRAALESSVIGGVYFSKKKREQQRLAIWEWVTTQGYVDFTTENEKVFFQLKVGDGKPKAVQNFKTQHEALEPLLWALGLVKKMSDYNGWVLKDFHPLLKITSKDFSSLYIRSSHAPEKLLEKCILADEPTIAFYSVIAMLWYWRLLEYKNPIFKKKIAKEVIIETFGEKYEDAASVILQPEGMRYDFMVNEKRASKLNPLEACRTRIIAQWRHHAFVWMLGDETWDDVKLAI